MFVMCPVQLEPQDNSTKLLLFTIKAGAVVLFNHQKAEASAALVYGIYNMPGGFLHLQTG